MLPCHRVLTEAGGERASRRGQGLKWEEHDVHCVMTLCDDSRHNDDVVMNRGHQPSPGPVWPFIVE